MSEHKDEPTPPRGTKSRGKIWRWVILGGLTFGIVAAYGIADRDHSDAELAEWTEQQAIPSVDVVSPHHPTQAQHLSLPADIEAFYTAPIHARVNGYVRMWYHDIGARVKAGDVLASIDTPDLDQQFEQAKGELSKANADFNLAELTAKRWHDMRASQAVSQQTADEKAGDALAKKAQVEAAQANVDRLKALEGFKNITAPFDGVITARRIDVGALVSSNNSNDPGLFEVAAVDKMRAYVRVPQIYAARLRNGMKVALKLPDYPGRTFEGTLTTTSSAISRQSRALLVELSVKNPDDLLQPGSYAEATFNLPLDRNLLEVPSSAVIFRNEKPKVATVDDHDKIVLKPINIAVDTGTTVEVSSGLDVKDRVVTSPSDSIENGDDVKIASVDGKLTSEKVASQSPRALAE